MSDAFEDERERIREQKRKELLEQLNEDSSGSSGEQREYDAPVKIQSQQQFNQLIEDQRLVLVDCYADWCGPCQMMEPTIEAVAAETPAVVAKVDVDSQQSLAAQLGAQSIPTLVLFVDGEPVERLVGAQGRGPLESLIQQYAE